jgi:proteasome accessory factor B
MERTERLLDLLALLLDAKEPVSWAELRESFPDDYGRGSDEAAERKFERDKAELLELGIPLTYVQGDDDRKDGYVVDREAYYLPEAGLLPEELAVLYAAGSAAVATGAFPGRSDLAHALRKIGFYSGTDLPTPRLRAELGPTATGEEVAQRLEELWAAASARKFVELTYYAPRAQQMTRRRVDPYGLVMRRGVWSLVGHCHLRGALRTFHVHRIRQLEVNAAKPRTADFEVPQDFRLADYVASYPWQHRLHEPVEVALVLRGELAPLATQLFPDATATACADGVGLSVRASYLDGLLRYALSLGHQCQVQAPPEAVARLEQMVRKVFEQHRPVLGGVGS